ncbi:MAG: hypothetical protein KBD44_01420 [Candidatus Pacebacteria bacterium]|nr:hypothetical protein [Candidatus Paceibacterota bacterium]
MKLDFRSVLILAVPILVLFALIFALRNWAYNYAEFQGGWALAAVYAAVIIIALLSVKRPDRGLLNILRRDMWFDAHYGRVPVTGQKGTAKDSSKAHRKFASTVGGHVAGLIGNLKRLAGHGVSGQPRLQVACTSA